MRTRLHTEPLYYKFVLRTSSPYIPSHLFNFGSSGYHWPTCPLLTTLISPDVTFSTYTLVNFPFFRYLVTKEVIPFKLISTGHPSTTSETPSLPDPTTCRLTSFVTCPILTSPPFQRICHARRNRFDDLRLHFCLTESLFKFPSSLSEITFKVNSSFSLSDPIFTE